MVIFELVRGIKTIYLTRLTKKVLRNHKRVPPAPSRLPFAWLYSVFMVRDEEVLRMVGLDGYMLLRFITLCLRLACFFAFFGVAVLVPVYSSGGAGESGWRAYTVANLRDAAGAYGLWAPVCFGYFFSISYCQLWYYEYKHYVSKRISYLVHGDGDTAPQTYYTVQIENLPIALRSTPALTDFFERIFPGEVFGVEIALDLKDLEDLTARRKEVRNALEKAIALFQATGRRPLIWLPMGYYQDLQKDCLEKLRADLQMEEDAGEEEEKKERGVIEEYMSVLKDLSRPEPITGTWRSCFASMVGCDILDSISHHTCLLHLLNRYVSFMQARYRAQRQQVDELENTRLAEMRRLLTLRSIETGAHLVSNLLGKRGERGQGGPGGNTDSGKRRFWTPMSGSSNYETKKSRRSRSQGRDNDQEKCENGEETFNSLLAGNEETKGTQLLAEIDESISNHKAHELLPQPKDEERKESIASEEVKVGFERDSIVEAETSEKMVEDEAKTTLPADMLPLGQEERLSSPSCASSVPASVPTDTVSSSLVAHTQSLLLGVNQGRRLAKRGVEGLAKEGLRTAEQATQGVLKGVLQATRALEYLTIGSSYRVSSTAFVTFQSRVAALSACQLLLSHDFYRIRVSAAPDVHDLIWDNVSLPEKQVDMRRTISNCVLGLGALFWSLVVTFISAITSLESISREIPALRRYSQTQLYEFFNYYLAIGTLLILLALLPYCFDFLARSYEGRKVESAVQSSILHRLFYYQLANIFVAVGLGSLATSLHEILSNPSAILSILGNSVASFSVYFANLLITRAFTGMPLEMLRLYNLLDMSLLYLCYDRRKCTRRELRKGPFADVPVLYGWIYPNLFMGLMVLVIYCCIAPLILPLCVVFFAFAYALYKYQLLYVFVNRSQAGGAMWHVLYDQSLLVLICGISVLVCYMGIRQTYISGPFYALLPLPAAIAVFWRRSRASLSLPARQLSLERAKEIDRAMQQRAVHGLPTPQNTFRPFIYRQPSLTEGPLAPSLYRRSTQAPSRSNGLVGTMPSIERHLLHGGNLNEETQLRDSMDSYYLEEVDEEEEGEEEVDLEVSLFLEGSTAQGLGMKAEEEPAAANSPGDLEQQGGGLESKGYGSFSIG
eukprot:scaffold5218_cov150-Ochromonas_danica.AAC.10